MSLQEETLLRKRIAKQLLAEILVPIKVKGPCGEARAWGVIDTGATISALMPEVIQLTCLKNERPGDIIVASGDTVRTRAGEVELQIGEGDCPAREVTVFEAPFNLIGMNYLDEVDAVVEARPGKIVCRIKE